LVFGYGTGQPAFAVVGGLEVCDDAFAVLSEGYTIFLRHGVELASSFVPEGANAGALRARVFVFGVRLAAPGFFLCGFLRVDLSDDFAMSDGSSEILCHV
jgi:hypothetical protein